MAVERIRILPYRLRGKQSLFHRETSSSTLKGKTDSKADHHVPDQVGAAASSARILMPMYIFKIC